MGIVNMDTVGQSANAKARVYKDRQDRWRWEWRDWAGGGLKGFATEAEAAADMQRLIDRETSNRNYRGRCITDEAKSPSLHFTADGAKNWARNTSIDLTGVFTFSVARCEPVGPFYVDGRAYSTREAALAAVLK